MRRLVWSCAGLMVCSGCQTVDRTAWFGSYGTAETPAVSSVLQSVQGPSSAENCGETCAANVGSPFGESRPLLGSPFVGENQTAAPSTYVDRSTTPAAPPLTLSAPPTTSIEAAPKVRVPAARSVAPVDSAPTDLSSERNVVPPSGNSTSDWDDPGLESDRPLVDVIIPPTARGKGYPSTSTPGEPLGATSIERLAPSDIGSSKSLGSDAALAEDRTLVPVLKLPSPPMPDEALPAAPRSSAAKRSSSPAIVPPQPVFRAGELAPLPAKPAPAAGSQLIQQPILLPAR